MNTKLSLLMSGLLIMGAGCVFSEETVTVQNTTAVTILIGTQAFKAHLYDTPAARAFASRLPLTLRMDELNGNEKYNYLDFSLPENSSVPDTIRNGDIMLYGTGCLVIFYKTFSSPYRYTRLGFISETQEFAAAIGSGSIIITFSLDLE